MAELPASKVRVRFAPSPTGRLHLGGGRTALINWLYARKTGGTFILRIEDTDKERSSPEYESEIIEAITWLGIDWDEGVAKEGPGKSYRQSERQASYENFLRQLLAEDKAYYCYCSKEDLEAERQLALSGGRPAKYSGRCRHLGEAPEGKVPQVIRIKNSGTRIEFSDVIRGIVRFDTSLLDDFIIARTLGEAPLYNFAVVVDDFEMDITHVIRGEEHLSNTPRQILIQQALGFPAIIYAHLPLVLNAKRGKLSKREADVALLSYRDKGFLPQAVANFLVLMGWHPRDNREVFTLGELVREFDIMRVQKAGAIFNEEKLGWLNREHLKRLPTEDLEVLLRPWLSEAARKASPEFLREVIDAVRERMHTLADFREFAAFFFELPAYERSLLVWKKGTPEEAREVLSRLREVLGAHVVYDAGAIEEALAELVANYGKGNVLWPLRAALSGQVASPDPFTIAAIFGKEEVLSRLAIAEHKLTL